MIDLHCHILPGIDDGPSGMEETLEMARIAQEDGIECLVATPHVKSEAWSPGEIGERVERVRQAVAEEGLSLKILQGADTSALLDPSVLKRYSINGTQYVLFEFPHTHLPHNAAELVFDAVVEGLIPIITHPERNPCILRLPQRLAPLVEGGALVQITAESLTGDFGPGARTCAMYLLRMGLAHFLASDAHSPRRRRPVLSRGRRIAANIVGEEMARRLVVDYPRCVIEGKTFHE